MRSVEEGGIDGDDDDNDDDTFLLLSLVHFCAKIPTPQGRWHVRFLCSCLWQYLDAVIMLYILYLFVRTEDG